MYSCFCCWRDNWIEVSEKLHLFWSNLLVKLGNISIQLRTVGIFIINLSSIEWRTQQANTEQIAATWVRSIHKARLSMLGSEVLIWRYPSQHAPNQTGLNRRQTIVHFIHIKEFMYWRACNPNLFIRKWHNAYKIQFQILSYKKNLDIVVSFLLWKLDHECKEFPAIWKSTNASSASYHRTINIFVATMERLTGITMQE